MRPRLALHLNSQCHRGVLPEEGIYLLPIGRVSTLDISRDVLPSYALFFSQTPPAKRQEYVNSFNKATQASRCESFSWAQNFQNLSA